MSDRLKLPPMQDAGFYQRRKHDGWREVAPPEPALEAPVADSHAHLHMLPDPAWELTRCMSNGVDWVCLITDPSEDGSCVFDGLDGWLAASPPSIGARIAVGVHPHNARLYTDAVENALVERLRDPRVVALGEIGLDYHYDLSPREEQRDVFRRQIALAKRVGLPIALHIRSGDDPERDNAHVEAFTMLQEADALGPRTLLHCCTLPPNELKPWVDADCYIAYGGALTFKNADAVRTGACLVPGNRLLFETDAPYMAPEPMRGAACTPAHVIFTAAAISAVRGHEPGSDRKRFLERVHENTLAFYSPTRDAVG